MSRAISVVGGMYGEDCAFPPSRILRGSGLRAACILSGLRDKVVLHSAIGANEAEGFTQLASARGIVLAGVEVPTTAWFRYRHPLSRPDIYFPHAGMRVPWGDVVASDALVFGMLEGRPTISAKRVVYDPQDGSKAKHFASNGSHAAELAIVASHSEGVALTGESDPKSIVASLLRTPNCTVAILKCGPQGALVATPRGHGWVGAFPSSRVWKIGSGDVFSAAFAHSWLKDNRNAMSSAWFASGLVSKYVETRQEVFSPAVIAQIRETTSSESRRSVGSRRIPKKHIYIAAPFFTTAERWMVDEAREAFLDMGFRVFSPIHDVGEGPAREVAPADLHALEQSGLVFALLDGLDPGTLFEVGYARASQIPVVGVCAPVMEHSMTMLQGSGCSVFDDFSTAMYVACWKLMGDV